MFRKNFKTTLVAASALILALSACSSPTPAGTGSGGASAPAGPEGSYVFLPKSLNNPYWVDAKKGMEAGAAKLGVKAEFLGPDTDDAAKQVAIFEAVLAKKPLGIAVSPNDPGSVLDVIARATEMGIPVIAWDGPVPNSKVLGYVGTDNVAAGEKEGEALAKAIGNKGKVGIIIGNLGAPNLNQRLEGVKKALAKYPDIQILATEESGESVANAQTRAETILQAQPDLAGFAGIGGSDLPGIVGALTSSTKCGTVKAVGFDVVPQGIEGMRNKCVDALISQRPFGMTEQALGILKDFHDGKSTLEPNFVVDTGVEVVTADTLEEFLKTDH